MYFLKNYDSVKGIQMNDKSDIMGIRAFYSWFKKRFHATIHPVVPTPVEVLALDIKGFLYDCVQSNRYHNPIELFENV